MGSILTLAKTEGMLFKFGSGAGTNLSPIPIVRGVTRGRRDGVRAGVIYEGLRRLCRGD